MNFTVMRLLTKFRMKQQQAVNETSAVSDLRSFWHVAKVPATKKRKKRKMNRLTFKAVVKVNDQHRCSNIIVSVSL